MNSWTKRQIELFFFSPQEDSVGQIYWKAELWKLFLYRNFEKENMWVFSLSFAAGEICLHAVGGKILWFHQEGPDSFTKLAIFEM